MPSSASREEVVPRSPAACTSMVLIASALVHGLLCDCFVLPHDTFPLHRHLPLLIFTAGIALCPQVYHLAPCWLGAEASPCS